MVHWTVGTQRDDRDPAVADLVEYLRSHPAIALQLVTHGDLKIAGPWANGRRNTLAGGTVAWTSFVCGGDGGWRWSARVPGGHGEPVATEAEARGLADEALQDAGWVLA